MYSCVFFGHRDSPESLGPRLYEAIENLILHHQVHGWGDAARYLLKAQRQKKSVILIWHHSSFRLRPSGMGVFRIDLSKSTQIAYNGNIFLQRSECTCQNSM